MVLESVILEQGLWLDHIFLLPSGIGSGIGRAIIYHLKRTSAQRNFSRMGLLADPDARRFYEKMGCRYLKEVASTIVGGTTPHLAVFIP
jgi:GNAT superfamily N-acetyltransferase